MGVMSCSRYGCHNIMCDTNVDGVGYVCSDCKTEFKAYLSARGNEPVTIGGINAALKVFMETYKTKHYSDDGTTVDEFFKSHTRNYI